jgi:RNA polymerase sigma-70 factor (ECF subfamily)
MKIEYTYRFATGDEVTVKISKADFDMLRELDRQLYNNQHKETRRRVSLDALDESKLPCTSASDPSCAYEKKEAVQALGEALRGLSRTQRELICKVFIDDIAPSQIARSEGVGKSAISHRIARSLKKLKKLLG